MIKAPDYLRDFSYDDRYFIAANFYSDINFDGKKGEPLLEINCTLYIKNVFFDPKKVFSREEVYVELTNNIKNVFFDDKFFRFLDRLYKLFDVKPEDLPRLSLAIDIRYEDAYLSSVPKEEDTAANYDLNIFLAQDYLSFSFKKLFYEEENDKFFKEHFGNLRNFIIYTDCVASSRRKEEMQFWPILYSTKLKFEESKELPYGSQIYLNF